MNLRVPVVPQVSYDTRASTGTATDRLLITLLTLLNPSQANLIKAGKTISRF
jgi:hypothetical protein